MKKVCKPSGYFLCTASASCPKDTEELIFKGKALRNIPKCIKRFTNLEKLDLSSNEIGYKRKDGTFTRIENLPESLKELDLSDNNIQKIEGLDKLENLEILDISNNPSIKKIEGLDNLKKLKKFSYLNSATRGINKPSLDIETGFEKLENLKELVLYGQNVYSIKGLDNLKKLKRLVLAKCKINEIKGLDNLEKLEKLDLSNNKIKKMEGVNNLKNLKKLDIRDNYLRVLENIDRLENLEELNLRENSISTVRIYSPMRKLRELNLYKNMFSQLEALSDLEGLEILQLSENTITSTSGLEDISTLKELYLNNNILDDRDINRLKQLKNLKTLFLKGNESSLGDITMEFFDVFPTLRYVDLPQKINPPITAFNQERRIVGFLTASWFNEALPILKKIKKNR